MAQRCIVTVRMLHHAERCELEPPRASSDTKKSFQMARVPSVRCWAALVPPDLMVYHARLALLPLLLLLKLHVVVAHIGLRQQRTGFKQGSGAQLWRIQLLQLCYKCM